MDDYNHLCPVCKSNGKTTFLQLRQINFTTATYLCKDIRCAYPQGHSWIFVDRDVCNGDESDSDSSNTSDEVNADIERMLMASQNSNTTHLIEYLSSSYTFNKDKIDLTSSQSAKGSIQLNVNTKIDSVVIDDADEHNSVSPSPQSTSEKEICDDVIIVNTFTEVDDVIIDDPDELFKTLDVPSGSERIQPKVLASGVPDSEIVNVTVSKDTKPKLLKLGKESSKFKDDIQIIDDKKSEIEFNATKSVSTEPELVKSYKELDEIKDSNSLKSSVKTINVPTNKNLCFIDLISGKIKRQDKIVNLIPTKKLDNSNIIKVSFDLSKVLNVSKNTNSVHELSSSEEENEIYSPIKLTNIDLQNIPEEKIVETDSNTSSEENSIERPGQPRRTRKKSLDLILPFVEDNDVNLELQKPEVETVFKSKLKLQSKKTKKSSFCFSDSIIKEALNTVKVNETKAEPQKNRSIVNTIFGTNNSENKQQNSASAFVGFKFSSEIIKQPNSNLAKKKIIKEAPSKRLVEHIQKNLKEKSSSKNRRVKKLEHTQSERKTEIVNNDLQNKNKDNVNLGLGDLTLNELFDNMDDLGTVNIPNNSVDISEVDDWLTSLCQ